MIKAVFLAAALAAAAAAHGHHHNRSHHDTHEHFHCIPELTNPQVSSSLFASCMPKLTGYSLGDFNVVSLSTFFSKGGDIEGRLLVDGLVNITGGFSIGDKIDYKFDHPRPFALASGGGVCWAEGSLFPNGEERFDEAKENYFAAEGYTKVDNKECTPRYLKERQGGKCATAGCLDDCFTDINDYYVSLANDWDTTSQLSHSADNRLGYWHLEHDSGLVLKAQSKRTDYAIFRVPNSVWAKAYYQRFHGCDVGNQYIIVVIVNDDNKPTVFKHGEFPGINEKSVFVFPGTGPDVVVEGGVQASILAPQRTFRQEYGVVDRGFLIAGNIASLHQVNKPRCALPDICPCCDKC